jgi:hypothetical protein
MYRQRAIYYTDKFFSASHLLRFVNVLHNTGEEAKVMSFCQHQLVIISSVDSILLVAVSAVDAWYCTT